jgi:hypothetical protein
VPDLPGGPETGGRGRGGDAAPRRGSSRLRLGGLSPCAAAGAGGRPGRSAPCAGGRSAPGARGRRRGGRPVGCLRRRAGRCWSSARTVRGTATSRGNPWTCNRASGRLGVTMTRRKSETPRPWATAQIEQHREIVRRPWKPQPSEREVSIVACLPGSNHDGEVPAGEHRRHEQERVSETPERRGSAAWFRGAGRRGSAGMEVLPRQVC